MNKIVREISSLIVASFIITMFVVLVLHEIGYQPENRDVRVIKEYKIGC